MLDERRALSFTYDAKSDIAKIAFEHSRMHAQAKTFPTAGRGLLLLDAIGFLVGVDLGGTSLERSVVMLGAHEDVARTIQSSIVLTRVGAADGYELQIPEAKRQIRAEQPNPYMK